MNKWPFFLRKKVDLKVIAFAGVALLLLLFGGQLSAFRSDAAQSMDIWWPVEGAKMKDIQPFKGMVNEREPGEYLMYWQVDNGQKVLMESNYGVYPHKEAQVDLSGWNWRGSGPYAIKFSAWDLGGNIIGERLVNIYLDTPPQQFSNIDTAILTSTTTGIEMPPQVQAVANNSTEGDASIASAEKEVEIWWPVEGADMGGVQPFKSLLKNADIADYEMYWRVDGGQRNLMPDNYTGSPHKEAQVDLSGWNWRGRGPYKISFVSEKNGSVLGEKTIEVYVGHEAASVPPSPVSVATVSSVATPSLAPAQVTESANSGNPLSGSKFYVNPNSNAKRQADAWRNSRPGDAIMMDKLSSQPESFWMGGWNNDITGDTRNFMSAAESQGATPVFIAYNVPFRDCGSYSAGGVGSADAYRNWISGLATGIGNRKAVVILEPDALSNMDCLSWGSKQERLRMLSEAISILKATGPISVYLDAGHARWVGASEMANRLKSAGIDKADGFSLNVSNFIWDNETIAYGEQISGMTGGKHFIVDSGRNGLGPSPDARWCNPSGRALGRKPTVNTGNTLIDAFVWAKTPGESDGSCDGAPSAGSWFPEYALGLAQRALW